MHTLHAVPGGHVPGESLTAATVTARLGIDLDILLAWADLGRFPRPIQRGTDPIWLADEVSRWVAERHGPLTAGTPIQGVPSPVNLRAVPGPLAAK